MSTIYEQMIEAKADIDHYESDLYVKSNPETEKIINKYQFKSNVKRFFCKKQMWYDIPFEYEPFWKSKNK